VNHPGRGRALDALRSRRRRIADTDVDAVLARIEERGLTRLVGPWLTAPHGRPATISARALLAGMFLAAGDNRGKVLLTEVTDTLYYEISPRMRERLGIESKADTDKGFEAAYAVVRRRFHRLARACDPSPLPKNKRLDKTDAQRLTAEADHSLLAEHRARLVELTNLILEDSLTDARPLLDEHWDGSGAVDGTAVRAYAKGLRSTGPVTATDPDAAWHVRTGDHADPAATDTPNKGASRKKSRKRAEYKYAYEATLAIARNPARDGAPGPDGQPDPTLLPALVLGFILDKPGHNPGGNAITVLRDVRRRGYQAGWMAGDRLFNNLIIAIHPISNSHYELWATAPSSTTPPTTWESTPAPTAPHRSKAPGTARTCPRP
jgi:hypothetical protein